MSFRLNGGNIDGSTDDVVFNNVLENTTIAELPKPSNPEKNGGEFTKWTYTLPTDLEGQTVNDSDQITDDCAIDANYDPRYLLISKAMLGTEYCSSVTVVPEGKPLVYEGEVLGWYYAPNTKVSCIAVAKPTGQFLYWGGAISSTEQIVEVTMDKNKTVWAAFGPQSTTSYTVTVNTDPTDGSGGTVTIDKATPAKSVTVTDLNEYHTVGAEPASGWRFVKWSDGGAAEHRVQGNKTLTATFSNSPAYTVTGIANPDSRGSVSGGGNNYKTGDNWSLTATPSSGNELKKWSSGETTATISGIITDSDITRTAYFRSTTKHTVTFHQYINSTVLASIEVSDGDGIEDVPTFALDGWTFEQWNDASGLKVDPSKLVVTGDIHLYAQWTKKYSVSLETTKSQTADVKDYNECSLPIHAKVGSVFNGSLKHTGTGIHHRSRLYFRLSMSDKFDGDSYGISQKYDISGVDTIENISFDASTDIGGVYYKYLVFSLDKMHETSDNPCDATFIVNGDIVHTLT